MLLRDQVAVITGSTRGIGYATARAMAAAGAAVVVNGTDAARVDAVVAEIQATGGQVAGVCASVTTMAGGAAIVETALSAFGRLDILVNNAGIVRDRMAHRMSEAEWDDVILTNLKGCFTCSRPALVHMRERKQGGCILNMTSTAGLHGTLGQLNYSAAKAGVLGFTQTLALELARDQISVNAIAPAALTDMTRPHVERATREAAERGTPLPDYWRIGAPEDVAQLVVALASAAGRSITGRIFSVNGDQIGLWGPPQLHMLKHRSDAARTPEALLTDILAGMDSQE